MIGRILAKLILGGLSRQTVSWKDVKQPQPDGTGDLRYFVDVMHWLQNEGIITYHKAVTLTGDFKLVQLTSKGLAAVENGTYGEGAEPTSIRAIVESTPDDGLTSPTYGKIGSLIGGMLGGFTKSIS